MSLLGLILEIEMGTSGNQEGIFIKVGRKTLRIDGPNLAF